MSLLMDALRKAEQQKQMLSAQSSPGQEPAFSSLELEPITSPATGGTPPHPAPKNPSPTKPSGDHLPELPTRLEDLDEQFMAHATKPPLKPNPPITKPPAPETAVKPNENRDDASPEYARKLFEAKQPAQTNNRSFAIAVGLGSLIAVAAIGGYFWWQLQPKGGLAATVSPLPSASPVSAPPIAVTTPTPASAVSPAPTFTEPAVAATPFAAQPANDAAANENIGTAPSRRADTRPAQAATAPVAQPQSPIRLTMAQQKINPMLDHAYQAFNRGEIDLARANWQKVLASDPRNADALHGLAAVAQQRQQMSEAADYYLRALESDPKDALALSGLVSLRAPTDSQSTENRLNALLAEQPDSPYLNFALGNLLARDSRWAEAQQAYFRAHTADASNPDYLFNLAVSLDQLHQSGLAIQYYKQALAAITRQPVGFDTAQVSARLKILQADLPH